MFWNIWLVYARYFCCLGKRQSFLWKSPFHLYTTISRHSSNMERHGDSKLITTFSIFMAMWHFQLCNLEEGNSFQYRWILSFDIPFFPVPFFSSSYFSCSKLFTSFKKYLKYADQICPSQHWHRNNFPNLWLIRWPREIPNFLRKWVDYLLIIPLARPRHYLWLRLLNEAWLEHTGVRLPSVRATCANPLPMWFVSLLW